MYHTGNFFGKTKKKSKSKNKNNGNGTSREYVGKEDTKIRISLEAIRASNIDKKPKGGGRKRKKIEEIEYDQIEDNTGLGEDEDFSEEHAILRAPTFLADKIRELIKTKDGAQSVNLTFSNPREGALKIKNKNYPIKLVDLPTIIESQKIYNNKQLVKIADISQMIVVNDPSTQPSRPNKKDIYSWPDGLTPPLKNVRKRRFRKRISKQTIEIVENELERLLTQDLNADDVTYELRDATDDNDSDMENEGGELNVDDSNSRAGTEALTPGAEELNYEDLNEEDSSDDVDFEELERVMEANAEKQIKVEVNEEEGEEEADEDDDEEDEDETDDSDDSESDDEETAEKKKGLREKIAMVEAMIRKKTEEYRHANNAIIKARFEDTLARLRKERDSLTSELEDIQ